MPVPSSVTEIATCGSSSHAATLMEDHSREYRDALVNRLCSTWTILWPSDSILGRCGAVPISTLFL